MPEWIAMRLSDSTQKKDGFASEELAWEYIGKHGICRGCRKTLDNGFNPEDPENPLEDASDTACEAEWAVITREEYEDLKTLKKKISETGNFILTKRFKSIYPAPGRRETANKTKEKTTMPPLDAAKGCAPEFWLKKVSAGSSIVLSNKIEYLVNESRTIKDSETGIVWQLFRMEGDDEIFWLLVKIVGEEIDIRAYFEPNDFETGDREAMVNQGQQWIFTEPKDTENFSFNYLEYAETIDMEVLYSRKPTGTLCGKSTCHPPNSALDDSTVLVTEYESDEDCDNPEAIILEYDGEDSDTGGFISLMVGCPLLCEDVEVL